MNKSASASVPPLLSAEHLDKVYPDGNVVALKDVSLTITPGEHVAVMGPSGCGKSTLLNLLGALDVPDSGEVFFEGVPLSRQPSLARLRSQKIGFVFQSFHLLPTLTSLENVQVPMFGGPLSASGRAERPGSCSRLSASATGPSTRPAGSRWGSGSGWPWPARWPTIRCCCSLMSRRVTSIPGPPPRCSTFFRL